MNTVQPSPRYLFSSSKDFWLLGGGSLFFLFLIRTWLPNTPQNIALSFEYTLLLANIINHPHFAISYLIFYSQFGTKLSTQYEKSLRAQYFFIGIIFPIILMIWMMFLIFKNNYITLGITANIMFFLVGWHYVKQGYGMLMLDAALKKHFFTSAEKTIFLRNAYAIWILAWMLANYIAKTNTPNYFGVPYQAVSIPDWAIGISALFAVCTTLQVLLTVHSALQCKRQIAWNGLIAYSVSLYAWLLVKDPIIVLWIPLFHSLQYLAVTCKFQFMKFKKETHKSINPHYKFYFSLSIAFLLGYLFFIQIPGWMDKYVSYNKEIFDHSLFLFVFWIFINIHHYLIDTVMWKKGNPEVQKYLFP